ncbi:MAG TPA: diguanylate cyclase, partial [Polyangiaceae bacterium]|nr:diguanylate cyclase [Polyangiaceae bacterium]
MNSGKDWKFDQAPSREGEVSGGSQVLEALPSAWPRIADLSGCATRRKAAEALVPIVQSIFGAGRVLVYLVADAASRPFFRAAGSAITTSDPAFCDEFELLRYARQQGLEVLRLSLPREAVGIVLLDEFEDDATWVAPLSLAVSLAFSAVWAREQSSRGAMRDASSSVYTLAYFVDVASRGLEVARRHERRFSVAMILIDPALGAGAEVANHLQLAAASSDIVARADDNEFYVLFPETDGVGAFFAKQRLIERLPGALPYHVSVGAACFPQDGTDVSRLMQRAKLRADAFARAANRYFGMAELTLPVLVDTLLALGQSRAETKSFAESLRYLDVSVADARALVLQCAREAVRAGAARV